MDDSPESSAVSGAEEGRRYPPLQPGQRRTVEITDIAFGGEGVGRSEGCVVFVPFVLLGEEAEVEIVSVHKGFARGRLLRVIRGSPHRVVPECPYFGDCGGCQYQHIAYPVQLELKRKQVADILERVGRFDPGLVEPVLPCPKAYGYRNRIMIRSQWNKLTQSLVIGYIRHDNRLVVDVEECRIAEPVLSEQLKQVRANPPPKGGLKVVLRLAPEDWVVPQDSFFQNNFHLLPGLVGVVRERLRQGACRFLVDAYCGVGFFALELADLVVSYVGIEYDTQAVRAAKRNASLRGRSNGEFLTGTVEALLPPVLERFAPDQTAVLVDPPRRGLVRSSLELLRAQRPAQILYVSCDPATLARDLRLLCAEDAYRLTAVVPVDMFPQTRHVECVADLRLSGPTLD